jgi:hypothetical protein
MKTVSLVLGIIGGVLAVIFAVMFIAGGALVNSMSEGLDDFTAQMEAEGWEVVEDENASALMSDVTGTASGILWLTGIASVVGAVLGIVGGALAKKRGLVAGILMLVAAVPSFFTGLGIIASALFIIGGVFAIIPQNSVQKAAA